MEPFILIALFVLFVLVSVLFYMIHELRQDLNSVTLRYGRNLDELNPLLKKMDLVWDALRELAGYRLISSCGVYLFVRDLKGKEGNSIDEIFKILSLLLDQLGYTFQPPTEEPAKLVKIEKKDVSQPVNALNLGGWSITQDGDRLKITNDGRFITYLNPNAEEPKPREETK